ncbi:MAG: LapA family protein [Bdellovibrionales bacterium]|nr:LapA family protein [Bdellovibrionales bacterium]
MKTFKVALWACFTLAFLVAAVSLIGQNQEPLSVEIFNYITPTYPKWIILLACIFLGAALASIFFVFELIVLETRNIRLRRLNQKLERAMAAAVPAATNGAGPHIAAPAMPRVTKSPSLAEDSDI